MDLIRLVRVSTRKEDVFIYEKAGLTQQLPQKGNQDEVAELHAETDLPVC